MHVLSATPTGHSAQPCFVLAYACLKCLLNLKLFRQPRKLFVIAMDDQDEVDVSE